MSAASVTQERNATLTATLVGTLMEFSGAASGSSWQDTKSQAANVAKALGVGMDVVGRILPLKFRGKALEHYFQVRARLAGTWCAAQDGDVAEEEYDMPWSELDAAMTARFESESRRGPFIDQYLTEVQGPTESAYEFQARLYRILRRSGLQSDIPEPLAVAIFRRKLRPPTRLALANETGLTSVDVLVAKAAECEFELATAQGRKEDNAGRAPNRHQAARTRPPVREGRGGGRGNPPAPAPRERQAGQSGRDRRQCYECGESGHIKRNCPNRAADGSGGDADGDRPQSFAARRGGFATAKGSWTSARAARARQLRGRVRMNGADGFRAFFDSGSDRTVVSRAAYRKLRVRKPEQHVEWAVTGALSDQHVGQITRAAWLRIEGHWVCAGISENLPTGEDVLVGSDLLCKMKKAIDYSEGTPRLVDLTDGGGPRRSAGGPQRVRSASAVIEGLRLAPEAAGYEEELADEAPLPILEEGDFQRMLALVNRDGNLAQQKHEEVVALLAEFRDVFAESVADLRAAQVEPRVIRLREGVRAEWQA